MNTREAEALDSYITTHALYRARQIVNIYQGDFIEYDSADDGLEVDIIKAVKRL